MNPSKLKLISILLIFAAVCASLGGCGITDAVRRATDVADNAVAVIDRGIADINRESASWQTILQRVANELPQTVSATIRNDVQNLATRSIAVTGVEVRCNIDFLARRAVQALEAVKAELTGSSPVVLSPVFCQVAPDAVDLNASPNAWAKITYFGYDLDHKDRNRELITFYAVDGLGRSRKIPESRIGRTTHYQVTLNLGEMAKHLHDDGVTKIVASWNDSRANLPEVVVLPWQPRVREERVSIARTSWMPPKVRGDRDFNTHGDEHMTVDTRGEFAINGDGIRCRAYLRAREPRHDWTEAKGWSDWASAYTAPSGWKIVEALPNTASIHTANIITHGRNSFHRPGGEIVSQFDIYGDHEGDEAGTWTRVEVFWRPVQIKLQELKPEWAY